MTHPPGGDMQVAVIIGTARPGNYTSKAAAFVLDELEALGIPYELFDPGQTPVYPPGIENDTATVNRLQKIVGNATGVILASPEYHGGMSSMLKATIENLGFPNALSGKPIALLGVAAGQIGAIKSLEQLRSICSHVGAIVLPGPVSVANVQKVFDADGRCTDPRVEEMIRGVPRKLVDYIKQSVCPRICLEEMVRVGTG